MLSHSFCLSLFPPPSSALAGTSYHSHFIAVMDYPFSLCSSSIFFNSKKLCPFFHLFLSFQFFFLSGIPVIEKLALLLLVCLSINFCLIFSFFLAANILLTSFLLLWQGRWCLWDPWVCGRVLSVSPVPRTVCDLFCLFLLTSTPLQSGEEMISLLFSLSVFRVRRCMRTILSVFSHNFCSSSSLVWLCIGTSDDPET